DAREAAATGTFFSRNYVRRVDRRATSPSTLRVQDLILRKEFAISTHRLVRAVGPWTDLEEGPRLLIPSTGTHIALPPRSAMTGNREADHHGLLLSHSRDGRVLF